MRENRITSNLFTKHKELTLAKHAESHQSPAGSHLGGLYAGHYYEFIVGFSAVVKTMPLKISSMPTA
jgi:hypothetical protein